MAFAALEMRLADKALKAAERELGRLERRARVVGAIALTKTAVRAKERITREIDRVFDRPTPYTKRAVYVDIARASRPELVASVRIADARFNRRAGRPQINWLYPNIEGGARQTKAFETALGLGRRMIVPAAGAELDRYGNIKASQIRKVVSYFGGANATDDVASQNTAERTKRRRRRATNRRYGHYFFAVWHRGAGRAGHLHPGIYEKITGGLGSRIRPVWLFVDSAQYAPRLDFDGIARDTFNRYIDEELDRALARERVVKG